MNFSSIKHLWVKNQNELPDIPNDYTFLTHPQWPEVIHSRPWNDDAMIGYFLQNIYLNPREEAILGQYVDINHMRELRERYKIDFSMWFNETEVRYFFKKTPLGFEKVWDDSIRNIDTFFNKDPFIVKLLHKIASLSNNSYALLWRLMYDDAMALNDKLDKIKDLKSRFSQARNGVGLFYSLDELWCEQIYFHPKFGQLPRMLLTEYVNNFDPLCSKTYYDREHCYVLEQAFKLYPTEDLRKDAGMSNLMTIASQTIHFFIQNGSAFAIGLCVSALPIDVLSVILNGKDSITNPPMLRELIQRCKNEIIHHRELIPTFLSWIDALLIAGEEEDIVTMHENVRSIFSHEPWFPNGMTSDYSSAFKRYYGMAIPEYEECDIMVM